MNSKKVVYQFVDQPIVWVKLENPHDVSVSPVEVRALIDTGAYASAVPAYLCQRLGHTFEDGITESRAAGIGAGTVRTFTHSTKLTMLFPNESDTEPPQTFEPIEFSCDFIEQPLPFVLLGQRDFLRLFRYAQNGSAGWFSLEQITKGQPSS
jgi:hypothetical protein